MFLSIPFQKAMLSFFGALKVSVLNQSSINVGSATNEDERCAQFSVFGRPEVFLGQKRKSICNFVIDGFK